MLGPFEARVGDSLVTNWSGRKPRLLLAYMAMERGSMTPRDVLIEMFWPGVRTERGANNLSIAVYQIRSSLASISAEAAKAITVRQGLYGIDTTKAEVDLWDLQARLVETRRALERKDDRAVLSHSQEAVNLYNGELMASDP